MADRNILYIEDNPENRLLVRRTLEASGYSVKEAVDGPSGLKAATESYPDVILLDISLPAMDGYDLARRFSEYAHLDDVPVLAVTANVMKGDKERALGAGCDGYIPKPINIDQLPKEIEEALQRFGRGDGPEPAESGTPPPRGDQAESRSDAVSEPPEPGSKDFDPSSLFAADADEGGAQSAEDEGSEVGTEPDRSTEGGHAEEHAGQLAGHPEADQTHDESVQQDDEVRGDAEGATELPSVEEVQGIPSHTTRSEVESSDDEADRGVASAVATPDQGLSEDEMLLREVFGPPKGSIGGVTGTRGRQGNGADRRPGGDEDDAGSRGETPLTRGDGRLEQVGGQGRSERMEETEEPSEEAEAVDDDAGEGVEAPADRMVDADRAAEQGTERHHDSPQGGEKMSADAFAGGDPTVCDSIDRESAGEPDADDRGVQDEPDEGQSSEPVSKPQPPSAGLEDSGPDGGEPGLPLEREAAVLDVMNGLADELGAEAVVLTQGPHLLASAGQMRAKGKQELAEILAEGFEASERVASLLGCERGCYEQIVDIGDFQIHARAVDGDLVMSTATRSIVPLGAARLWVKRSAARVESLVGEREEK